MLKNACFILLLSALIPTAVYSNADDHLFPGYYIDAIGDSVRCLIEFNDWVNTPTTIKAEIGGVRKTLGPEDIRGFGVTGYDDYRSATVTYHTGRITEPGLPEEFPQATETKARFLKIVVHGYYSLYELVLPQRPCYFLEQHDSSMQELVYQAKVSDMSILEDLTYKVFLRELFSREGILHRFEYLIGSATYTGSSLRSLVNHLNEAHTGVKTVRIKSKTHPFRMDIYGGLVMNTYPNGAPSHFTGAVSPGKIPPSMAVEGGLGVQYVIPNHFHSLILGFSVGYSQFQGSGSGTGVAKDNYGNFWYTQTNYNEQLSFSNTMALSNLYVMYSFAKWKTMNIYGKAGFDYNLLLKSGAVVRSNYSGSETLIYTSNGYAPSPEGTVQGNNVVVMQMARKAVCANIGVGLEHDRQRIELLYYAPMEMADQNQPSFNLSRFTLCYRYTLLK